MPNEIEIYLTKIESDIREIKDLMQQTTEEINKIILEVNKEHAFQENS